MKKLLLLCSVLASFLANATEWTKVQTNVTTDFKDVYMANPEEIIVVGASGKVLKTIDGGQNWTDVTVKTTGTTNQWEAIHFVNDKIGYLGGQYENIYQTIDGGNTWNSVYTIQSSSSQIFDIKFFDINNGIGVGRSGELVVTTDGGKTWNDNISSPNKYNGVTYLNKDLIYAVGSDQVATSINGGTSWTANASGNILGVSFVNDTIGFRVGAAGLCEKTIDAGKTWTKVDLKITTSLYKVEFDGMKGYIVGATGVVFETMDGGKNWMKIDVKTTKDLYSINMKGNTTFIVGQDGTILTLGAKKGVISSDETINYISKPFVFPNSVIDVLTISEEMIEVKVYNQNGKLVSQDFNTDSIDLSSLESGIYFVSLLNKAGKFYVERIIK